MCQCTALHADVLMDLYFLFFSLHARLNGAQAQRRNTILGMLNNKTLFSFIILRLWSADLSLREARKELSLKCFTHLFVSLFTISTKESLTSVTMPVRPALPDIDFLKGIFSSSEFYAKYTPHKINLRTDLKQQCAYSDPSPASELSIGICFQAN